MKAVKKWLLFFVVLSLSFTLSLPIYFVLHSYYPNLFVKYIYLLSISLFCLRDKNGDEQLWGITKTHVNLWRKGWMNCIYLPVWSWRWARRNLTSKPHSLPIRRGLCQSDYLGNAWHPLYNILRKPTKSVSILWACCDTTIHRSWWLYST